MGAIQAQDYPGSKWAIGLRLPNATEADIEQAVAERKILRTWPMRGTIHFVVPEEAGWRLALSTPRILAAAKRRHENLNLSQSDFDRARELFAKALQGDKQLSRPEMMQVLEHGGISTASQRGYHILWYLAQTGFLCFGPLQGKQITFALLDDWTPKAAEVPREEALAKLTKTYFTSHGPATVQDLIWWSGLTAADVKAGLESVKDQLISHEQDGRIYWMGSNLPKTNLTKPLAHLLPPFDEYLLGYKNRSAVLEIDHAAKVAPGANGMFSPLIVINGKIVGTWKRVIKKRSLNVQLQPFTSLNKAARASIDQPLKRYSEFMNMPTNEVE